ncbi:Uncharacterised protein [Mycobacteroides abscessus subsp. abscessus]|nr:Uncharacterised protein [Mycobacteroides abscessus subsp. abscessus]
MSAIACLPSRSASTSASTASSTSRSVCNACRAAVRCSRVTLSECAMTSCTSRAIRLRSSSAACTVRMYWLSRSW